MDVIKFAEIVGKLKRLKRTGWVIKKIPEPESVAEHSYRVAMLALILAPKLGVNQQKAVNMALLHDLGEAEIGDIVTVRGRKRLPNLQDKLKRERHAMQQILSLVDADNHYLDLFDEYEENKTPEAQLVKQLDRLELGVQALEYEQQHAVDLEEFFQTTQAEVLHEELKHIVKAILALRTKTTKSL